MSTVADRFEKIGTRASIVDRAPRSDFVIDVRSDRRGEFFDLRVPSDVTLEVLDVRPEDRHLLLLVRGEEKHRFLCGHDERRWFVAAIPEISPVSTVAQARDALKPPEVRAREKRVRRKHRDRRRGPAYVRQGEWFFVATPNLEVEQWHMLYDEPLTRSPRSTPHVAEEAVRLGGETVYIPRLPWRDRDLVLRFHPEADRGLTEREHEAFVRRHPQARGWNWQVMRRNPELYVRGRVTHPDHRTIVLKGWHRVLMNTEPQARARSNVAFLD